MSANGTMSFNCVWEIDATEMLKKLNTINFTATCVLWESRQMKYFWSILILPNSALKLHNTYIGLVDYL